MTSLPVICPSCRAIVTSQPIHSFTPEQSAAHFCPVTRDLARNQRLVQVIRHLWGDKNGQIFVCERCGFGFGHPHIGGDEAFYAIMHESQGYPTWRWEYGRTIDCAKRSLPNGGRALDMGAGGGAFLRRLDNSWEKCATEGSDATRSVLCRSGIHCFASIDDALAEFAGTFDLVTMFQVLEHVSDFKSTLKKCYHLLRPGGLLSISVPNGDVLYTQEILTGHPDMIPNHINKFRPQNLIREFEDIGLREIQHELEPPHITRAIYCATLVTRTQASTRPKSLAAKAWAIPSRCLRTTALSAISTAYLLARLPSITSLMRGGTLLVTGRRVPPGFDVQLPSNVCA